MPISTMMQSKHHRAVEGRELTRQHKARIAEAAVLFRLSLHGFATFGATFDGEKSDWLVETVNGVKKVQVKWMKTGGRGERLVRLQCTEGHNKTRRYNVGEFDFIVGYDLFSDTAYVWSWLEVEHLKSAVMLNENAAERWDKLRV